VSRSEKSRPLELVGISIAVAVFVGAIVMMVTKDLAMSAVFAGVAFIVTILMLAMLVLATSPQLPPRSENPHDI
jgi:hypothetical protein